MECRATPRTASRGVAAVVVVAALCAAFAGTNAAPVYHSTDSVPASVREVPQRPMTVKSDDGGGSGGDADPFPISRGEPFVVDPANVPRNHGPITGFNVRPPGPRSAVPPAADEYAGYDYDATKLEEVPFDYQGDPIDRKDVHPEPGSARPNDIVKPVNKPQQQSNSKLQTPTDIYQFLNLPKQYSSSDFKFPLVSSSYANTKVQGSGTSSSSSLSNHKMPDASTTTSAPTTSSRYNPTVVKSTAKPATTRPPSSTTSTTTTMAAPSQEYEEYDYNDYGYHPQEPALSPSTTTTTTAAATTATAVTTTTTANPTTTTAAVAHREPSFYITPEPATSTADGTASFTGAEVTSTVENAHRVPSTTTFRPEIDSKLDGTSFADYDAIKPPAANGGGHAAQQHGYGQPFKPLPSSYLQQSYAGDDKTYPLLTDGKTPMTFTAHVSSGISLNQKDQQPAAPESAAARPSEVGDASGPSSAEPPPAAHPKPKPSSRPAAVDHRFEAAIHHHVAQVRPDAYDAALPAQQQFAGAAVQSRPIPNQPQSRPYQEPLAVKTTVAPVRKHAPALQAYPAQSSAETYAKTKPLQYVPPPQSPVDTSKFKPPKHVINHFIKTLPDEDNKSYALQTSFSIGMDGERAAAETRPGQGVGQVLMVKDGSPSEAVDQPIPAKPKPSTAPVPLVPPPRLAPKPQLQQYPRPPWENAQKQSGYYPPPPPPQQAPSPKRDGPPPPPPPPPQRTSLPNILPQFRPNAKIDAPLVQPHSATIERVQIPMDHLRPPPLPKPQFLKMDRNDENADEESRPDVSEKETRTATQRIIGPPQPARVTTLQMIQHGAPGGAKTREDGVQEGPAVHVVYAADSPPTRGMAEKTTTDDSTMMMMDAKDRSDVPVLKTKTITAAGKPAKTGGDFPYRIVRPEDVQNASSPPTLEYQAYSPTIPEAVSRPDVDHQQLVPNLQDYVPVSTRDTAPIGGFAAPAPQRPIAATLKTTAADDHRHVVTADEGQRGPQLQNFQIPFQPSMKLPENTNGWSVVRKSVVDGGASDRMDEAGDAAAASTEKFDPDNFKPHLVGGFVPIGSPLNDAEEKKLTDRTERA